MIIFYSGSSGTSKKGIVAEPEVSLGLNSDIMLSYYLIKVKWQQQDIRFPIICKSRKNKRAPVKEDYLKKYEKEINHESQ